MPGSPRWIALLLLLPPLAGCEHGSPLLATAVEDVAPGPRAPRDLGVDGQPDAMADASPDVSRFWHLGEMLQQGIINHIALARAMAGVCSGRAIPGASTPRC